MKNLIKRIESAFGKDVYLLGEEKEGVQYWLEAPSWDCDWYWGFGYIETYTNNTQPQNSRDCSSHEHANGFMSWVIGWNGKEPKLINTTFNNSEAWRLVELFKRFYMFKDLASYYHGGSCGVTGLGDDKKNQLECDRINQIEIRYVMDEILNILKG